MPDLFQPFPSTVRATFVRRPNRFIVACEVDGRLVSAFLPNPGKLQELLLPGRTLYLAPEASPSRRIPYTAVAVVRAGVPIMLHTIRTNDTARYLLERRLIPGLEDAAVVRSEVAVGRSRFDFLLERGGRPVLLEVKSCTLTAGGTAMFPDAVTERGRRHLAELSELAQAGHAAAVLFIVHDPSVSLFMPDYHTDLAFARTLLSVRQTLDLFPVAVRWNDDLSLSAEVRPLTIPWERVESEAKDRGSYILVLEVDEDRTIEVGALGGVVFRKGFYLYVGSAMANLQKRLDRHRRLRKRLHWHIDYLRQAADIRAIFPIRSSLRLECAIAQRVSAIAGWSVPGFGCSDCGCRSHLFGAAGDPRSTEAFQDLLQHFRLPFSSWRAPFSSRERPSSADRDPSSPPPP